LWCASRCNADALAQDAVLSLAAPYTADGGPDTDDGIDRFSAGIPRANPRDPSQTFKYFSQEKAWMLAVMEPETASLPTPLEVGAAVLRAWAHERALRRTSVLSGIALWPHTASWRDSGNDANYRSPRSASGAASPRRVSFSSEVQVAVIENRAQGQHVQQQQQHAPPALPPPPQQQLAYRAVSPRDLASAQLTLDDVAALDALASGVHRGPATSEHGGVSRGGAVSSSSSSDHESTGDSSDGYSDSYSSGSGAYGAADSEADPWGVDSRGGHGVGNGTAAPPPLPPPPPTPPAVDPHGRRGVGAGDGAVDAVPPPPESLLPPVSSGPCGAVLVECVVQLKVRCRVLASFLLLRASSCCVRSLGRVPL
jgi:hypothetical protein